MVVLKCFTGFKHINSNYVNKWRKCNIMSSTSATSAPFIAATFMFSPVCALCLFGHFSYGEETS